MDDELKPCGFCGQKGIIKPAKIFNTTEGGRMSDLAQYFHAQDRKESAYQQYNYAGMKLENEQIKCRLAQIKSQANPIDSLMLAKLSERERLYAIAFFVVIGRFPEGLQVVID